MTRTRSRHIPASCVRLRLADGSVLERYIKVDTLTEAAEEGARQPAVERAQVQPTARAEQRAGEPEHAAGRASAEQVRNVRYCEM